MPWPFSIGRAFWVRWYLKITKKARFAALGQASGSGLACARGLPFQNGLDREKGDGEVRSRTALTSPGQRASLYRLLRTNTLCSHRPRHDPAEPTDAGSCHSLIVIGAREPAVFRRSCCCNRIQSHQLTLSRPNHQKHLAGRASRVCHGSSPADPKIARR